VKLNVADFLSAFVSNGWDGINAIGQGPDAPSVAKGKDASALSRAYFRLFSTADGQMVLNDLLALTLLRKSWDGNRPLLDGIAYGYMREGQNGLVAMILSRIAAASQDGLGSFNRQDFYHEQETKGDKDDTDNAAS
jgi:hypothetical protein